MKLKNITRKIKGHLVDTTGLLVPTSPVYAGFEVFVAGMNDSVSLKARAIISGVSYLGFGSLFSKGRDFSRKKFNINDKTKESIQYVHDLGYSASINLVIGPLIYLASGETDIKKIAIGVGTGMAFSTITGWPMGYSIDMFRDLMGIRKSERISKKLSGQNPIVKKGLAALLVGSSVAAMAGIYSLS